MPKQLVFVQIAVHQTFMTLRSVKVKVTNVKNVNASDIISTDKNSSARRTYMW